MARPLKGSLHHKGSSWVASVPRIRGSRERISCSFPTGAKSVAKQWIATQIERLEAGLEAEQSSREARVQLGAPATEASPGIEPGALPSGDGAGDGPDFEETANRMVRHRYDYLRQAGPERASEVRRIIAKHLVPAFAGPISRDPNAGRERVIQWVVSCAGRTIEGSSFPALAKPVKRTTMNERLRILRMILEEAGRFDSRILNFADDIHAQDPVGKVRMPPRLLSLAETALLAGEMHVIHQLVLWMLRVLGCRISEPYGIRVRDFIDDGDTAMFVLRAQGGRSFSIWGDDVGEVETVNHKEQGKTDAAFRVVGVPRQLAALVRFTIDAFHTDPVTGAIDMDARLVPCIQSAGGGQAGFRSALTTAGEATGIVALDERLIPHDARKNLCADFAWNGDLDDVLKRRWVGHRAGTDVFAVIYTLDRRIFTDLLPAVNAIETQIEEIGGTLLLPTSRRPLYRRSHDPDRLAHADEILSAAGWQVPELGPEWLTTSEAASLLDRSVTATGRLFPAQIPAIKKDGNWYAKRDDVIAFDGRNDGWRRIEDIAESTGADYHTVHRTLARLEITGTPERQGRHLLFTEDDELAVTAELTRIQELRRRAVSVADAARLLRSSQSSIRLWATNGRLEADPEDDGSSRTYITRKSIDAERARRGLVAKAEITAEELREYAGIDSDAVRALVRAGHLQRIRTGTYTVASVRRWATGFRPDLLDCGLFPPQ